MALIAILLPADLPRFVPIIALGGEGLQCHY